MPPVGDQQNTIDLPLLGECGDLLPIFPGASGSQQVNCLSRYALGNRLAGGCPCIGYGLSRPYDVTGMPYFRGKPLLVEGDTLLQAFGITSTQDNHCVNLVQLLRLV